MTQKLGRPRKEFSLKKFLDYRDLVAEGRLTKKDASMALGVSVPTFRRLEQEFINIKIEDIGRRTI